MLRLTIALLVGIWGASLAAAAPTVVDTESLFQKGLGDYQAKNFAQARDDFARALEHDPTNTRLLHNLALTHYQLKESAPAIAYWRKALAIAPEYRPARLGRELMETKMSVRPFERDLADLWAARALERISLLGLGWILAVVLAVVGFLTLRDLGQRRAARDRDQTTPGVPLGALAGVVILIFGLVVLGLKLNQVFTPRATVIGEKVTARSLPADEGVQLFEVPGGTEVLVRHRQGEWRQVENPEGSTGWVKRADLVPESEG